MVQLKNSYTVLCGVQMNSNTHKNLKFYPQECQIKPLAMKLHRAVISAYARSYNLICNSHVHGYSPVIVHVPISSGSVSGLYL